MNTKKKRRVHVPHVQNGPIVFHGKFEGKECRILHDSGASSSFIRSNSLKAAGLVPDVVDESYSVEVADGKSITLNQEISGRLQIDRYQERRRFKVFPMRKFDIILGKDWLQDANPKINWKKETFILERERVT